MLRVGLTGGLASGKSFVGRALADLGCYLIEADKLGHEVMLPGGDFAAARLALLSVLLAAAAVVLSEFAARRIDHRVRGLA